MRADILEQAQAIRAATVRALGHVTADDDRLEVAVLYAPWGAGDHKVGEVYSANGQVWECCQAYDNAVTAVMGAVLGISTAQYNKTANKNLWE